MGKTVFGFILGILIVPAIGAAVVFTGHFPFEATSKPPGWERQIANMALDPALEKKTEGLANPISVNDESLLKGMKLYRDDCARCHGEPGRPSRWGGTTSIRRRPDWRIVASTIRWPRSLWW